MPRGRQARSTPDVALVSHSLLAAACALAAEEHLHRALRDTWLYWLVFLAASAFALLGLAELIARIGDE